jgi:hypothetical protein
MFPRRMYLLSDPGVLYYIKKVLLSICSITERKINHQKNKNKNKNKFVCLR